MKHTYIIEEGTWQAEGTYTDEHGNVIPARGETTIVHRINVWIHEGAITLLSEPSVEFSKRYTIKPIEGTGTITTWTSENPSLGKFKGTFVFTGNTILSASESEDGNYRGMESLTQLDEDTYQASGSLLQGTKRLSSWDMKLRRRSEP